MDGCEKMPCPAYVGTNVSGLIQNNILNFIFLNFFLKLGVINFEAENVLAETMRCELYAFVAGAEVKFPGGAPSPNACLDMRNKTLTLDENEGQCPVYPGEAFFYEVFMPIYPLYPQVKTEKIHFLKFFLRHFLYF